MHLFFFFHLPFSLPWPLFFLRFFLSTPASNPDDLVISVCVRTFYLPLFYILSRASTCALSNKLSKSICNFSDRRLWKSWDFILFFEAPAAKHDEDPQVSLHSLERILWVFSPFPPKKKHSQITRFALSLTVNLTSQILKNKFTRICLFDGSFAPVIWWFAAPTI